MNHLDRCQTDLDVTIVRADSPTTHIATITETQADGVRSYTLTLAQHTPPTPGEPEKLPLVVPVAVGTAPPSHLLAVPQLPEVAFHVNVSARAELVAQAKTKPQSRKEKTEARRNRTAGKNG